MRTVLVVHAAPEWAATVVARLRADGWAAEAIEGGERALDRFVQEPSDAVVVDLDLRGRDGAATIESLRWAPGGRALPIVLTGIAAGRNEVMAVARELGVDAIPNGDVDTIAQLLARALPPTHAAPASVELLDSALLESASNDDEVRLGSNDVLESALVSGSSDSLLDSALLDSAPLHSELVDGDGDAGRFDDDLYTAAPPRQPTVPPPSRDPQGGREGVDVERRARALAAIAEVEGTLQEVEIAVVLARLADLRATGALVVEGSRGAGATTTGESPKKVVFFRNGVPVHVRSNLEDECLGRLLVRRGIIDRATMEESLGRVRDGDGRQGGILVAMGALQPRELREALEQQQEQKLFGLFAWRQGSFHFSDAMHPPTETITLELSLAEIVTRALETHVTPEEIEARSRGALDRFVWPSELGLRGLEQVLEEREREVLRSIDGRTTLRALLERQPEHRAAILRAIHAARCLGGVAFRESARERNVTAADRNAAASTRLRELLAPLRAERYAEVFEVAAETDLVTLRRRGAALRAEALALREDLPSALLPLADELHRRLGRAEAVLVADRERTDASAELPPTSAEGSSDREPKRPFAMLGTHDAVTRELPAAMALPVRTESKKAASASPVPAVPEAKASTDAPDPTRPMPKPPAGEGPTREVDVAEVNALEASMAREPSLPTDSLDERVERMLQAERAMRRARRAIERQQLDVAREAVARAVVLVPDEPEFSAELAWLDAKEATDDGRRRALEQLDEAARSAPKNARIHVLRADVLRWTGAEADARAAYERALAANPDDPRALDGLRALVRPVV